MQHAVCMHCNQVQHKPMKRDEVSSLHPALQLHSASSLTGSGSCCMPAKHTVEAACVQSVLHMHSASRLTGSCSCCYSCCMPACLLSTQSCMSASSRVEQGSHMLPSLPRSVAAANHNRDQKLRVQYNTQSAHLRHSSSCSNHNRCHGTDVQPTNLQ
jgi:hypothetical protein